MYAIPARMVATPPREDNFARRHRPGFARSLARVPDVVACEGTLGYLVVAGKRGEGREDVGVAGDLPLLPAEQRVAHGAGPVDDVEAGALPERPDRPADAVAREDAPVR